MTRKRMPAFFFGWREPYAGPCTRRRLRARLALS
jgi:hypothetical protein